MTVLVLLELDPATGDVASTIKFDPEISTAIAIVLSRGREHIEELADDIGPDVLAQARHPVHRKFIGMLLRSVNGSQQVPTAVAVSKQSQDGLSDRPYLNPADVVELTGRSLRTVRRWIKSGALPSVKHGQLRSIRRSDLDEFMRAK